MKCSLSSKAKPLTLAKSNSGISAQTLEPHLGQNFRVFSLPDAEIILYEEGSFDKFIKPDELIDILEKNNLKLEKLDGLKFNLITDEWKLSSDKSINYIAKFIKN